MANGHLQTVLQHIRRLAGVSRAAGLTDGRLLERFASCQDEAAFEALLERHGPMVLAVCRRVLHNLSDADDAFQATFLVLISKAGSIRKRESVSSWLHGVAYRTACRARARAARRHTREEPIREVPDPLQVEPDTQLAWRELRAVLDEELGRLPEKYRVPLVLCYLEGMSNAEAAQQLGWPIGTVQVRLLRAREILRIRLARRGAVFSGCSLAGAWSARAWQAAVPPELAAATLRMATLFAGEHVTAGMISTQVAALAKGVLRTLLLTKLKIAVAFLLAVSLVGAAAGVLGQRVLAKREANAQEKVVPNAGTQSTAVREHSERNPSTADLTQIDRKIAKEPVYKSKPKYCLLVFGPQAKKHVWLVQDGDTLYVDRNGNGDLTEAGEKVAGGKGDGTEEGEYQFPIGDIQDGTLNHKAFVEVRKLDFLASRDERAKTMLAKYPKGHGYAILIEMDMPGTKGTGIGGRVRQTAPYLDVHGVLQFADRPQEAPIIHFGGSWQIMLFGPQTLTIGRERDMVLGVGTPGLGAGTTAYIDYEGVIPQNVFPTVEVTYPPQKPGTAPVRERYELKRRC